MEEEEEEEEEKSRRRGRREEDESGGRGKGRRGKESGLYQLGTFKTINKILEQICFHILSLFSRI